MTDKAAIVPGRIGRRDFIKKKKYILYSSFFIQTFIFRALAYSVLFDLKTPSTPRLDNS